MKTWYRVWHWLCARAYFERITVLRPDRLPPRGPVLYVGLHRNGAVDGFVYRQVAPRCVFLVSTQLLRSFFARLFFHGIAVARTKDAERDGNNDAALGRCTDCLEAGGELFVFPEGTSSLGPRHLPFKSGAARIALEALARGIPLRILPLGIHYERAWAFRSRVEVIVGQPVATDFPTGADEWSRLKEMKRRLTVALESVGANFASSEAQVEAERLAYAATLGTTRACFDGLKAFEAGVPESLARGWRELDRDFASCRVWRHQAVPLFPAGSWMLDALRLLVLGPVALAGALLNGPPLFAAWLAARKFADDRNVIALWRILVGMPATILWSAGVSGALAWFAGWVWALAYAVVSLAALQVLGRTRKLAVSVWNGVGHRSLALRAREFQRELLRELSLIPVSDGHSRLEIGGGLKLLPHEWCFGAFLVVQWLRLVVKMGFFDRDALLYAALLVANGIVIGWGRRHATRRGWYCRLWFYPVVMNIVFMTMNSAVLKVSPRKLDDALAGFDRALFGATLSQRAEAISTPVLTEILSFCYLLFFPYLIVSWFYYAGRGLPIFRRLIVGLFTIYGLGFLGYSLVPAGGPHLAFREEFSAPLTGWAITQWNSRVVAAGSNGVDVFPSLHCAVSSFLLFFDRGHAPWRHRLYWVPCIGLWISTIYLRYHYVVDVVVGFGLAAFALWLMKRWAAACAAEPETP